MADNNLVPGSLAQLVERVGPETPITILGDADHTDLAATLALMSPETVEAAARAGKTAMIFEIFSSPDYETSYNMFRDGKASIEALRTWAGGIDPEMLSPDEWPAFRENMVNMFVVMKEHNMQLISPDRNSAPLLPSEVAHPEFVDFLDRSTEAYAVGGREAVNQMQVPYVARDPNFIVNFNAWMKVRSQEADIQDAKTIQAALDRYGNPPTLIVWGDDHNSAANDLDEVLGDEKTTVISVYPSTQTPQVLQPSGDYRQEMPDYVYYVREAVAGQSADGIDMRDPSNVSYPTEEALESLRNNTLVGAMRAGFSLNPQPADATDIGALPRVKDQPGAPTATTGVTPPGF